MSAATANGTRPLAWEARNELEALVEGLRARLAATEELLAESMDRERSTFEALNIAAGLAQINHDNLTATQDRCSELLLEARRLRPLEALVPLHNAIVLARAKHPGGPDLRSLVEEVGEVANAMRRETPERVKEELLDVAVVALRLAFGEGKL